jgi:hypothetical protein
MVQELPVVLAEYPYGLSNPTGRPARRVEYEENNDQLRTVLGLLLGIARIFFDLTP